MRIRIIIFLLFLQVFLFSAVAFARVNSFTFYIYEFTPRTKTSGAFFVETRGLNVKEIAAWYEKRGNFILKERGNIEVGISKAGQYSSEKRIDISPQPPASIKFFSKPYIVGTALSLRVFSSHIRGHFKYARETGEINVLKTGGVVYKAPVIAEVSSPILGYLKANEPFVFSRHNASIGTVVLIIAPVEK